MATNQQKPISQSEIRNGHTHSMFATLLNQRSFRMRVLWNATLIEKYTVFKLVLRDDGTSFKSMAYRSATLVDADLPDSFVTEYS